MLLFLIYLPLAIIWFTAFYGYNKLKQYARSVRETPEGLGYEGLARGFTWLSWGLLVPVTITIVLHAISGQNPNFNASAIIISNYISLIFPLIAFSIINNASHRLVSRRGEDTTLSANKLIMILFIVLGVAYCYLVFKHIDGHGLTDSNNPYMIPVWLIITTIVIPYLYAWFVGLLAAYDLHRLSKRAKGVLYRQALSLLSRGATLVIVSLISVQYLRSVVPRTGHFSLSMTLVTTYLIFIIMMFGFIMISLGASRLKRMEDI